MALLFTDNSATQNVNHGSATSLDDLTNFTLLFWLMVGSTANAFRHVVAKTNSDGFNDGWCVYQMVGDGTRLRITYARSGADQDVRTATSTLSAGTWQCLAFTINTAGSPACYAGNLTTAMADVSNNVTNGSGTYVSAAAYNLYSGANLQFNPSAIGGRIALVSVFTPSLTLAQIEAQRQNIWVPVVPANCVLFSNYGFDGATTAPDWSGRVNNGTVTGATAIGHVPLPPRLWSVPWVVVPAAAAPVTINCALGTLVLAGQASTISATGTATISAALGTLTLAGQAATISATGTATVSAALGTMVLAGQAATVSATGTATISAALGTLTLAGQAATVSVGLQVNAALGTLTLAGQAASVSATGTATVAANTGALVLAGQSAAISATGTATVAANTGTLVFAGLQASITFPSAPTVTVVLGLLSLAGLQAKAMAAVAPAERIYSVLQDDRTYSVLSEDRTFSVTED